MTTDPTESPLKESAGTGGPTEESVLYSILEATADGILVVTLDGEILHYNRRFAEIWGLPESVLETRSDEKALQHALERLEDPEAFLRGVQELYENPRAERYDLLRFADGRLVRRYARPLVVEGEATGRVFSFRDVTEQLETEEALRERTQVFEAILSASPVAIDVLDRDGNVILWNEAAERIFGWSAAEVVGGAPPMVPEGQRPEFESVLDAVLRDERRMGYETRRRRKDGSLVDVAVWAAPLEDEEGEVTGAVGLFADITGRKQVERALRESEHRYRTLFEESRDAIVIASPEGEILEANPAAVELAGLDPDEQDIQGWTADDFYVDPADRRRFLRTVREKGYVKDFEVRYRNRDGEVMHCLETATEWRGPDGEVKGYLSILRDVTEEKRAQARLEEMAFTDPLTGLANRRLLRDRAEQALAAADRRDTRVGLVYLDLRRFKAVNDSLGHAAGDQALRLVAERLGHRTREADTLARLGGDEFGVLLTDVEGAEKAREAAERLEGAFREPFEISGQPYRLGAAIGVSLYPDHAEDFEGLVRRADTAMYAARDAPPRLYSPDLKPEVARETGLDADFGRALDQDELLLHLQPIVPTGDGRPGSEALLRWRHPERGLLQAREFLPLATEEGWIRRLDRWALREAVRGYGRWWEAVDAGERPWLAVNLSGSSLVDPELVDYVEGLLDEAPEEDFLVVEVAEEEALRDPEAGARVLGGLRELGVSVALDDIGSGHVSLNHLRWFSADFLKVDVSLTRKVREDSGDEAMIRAIIAMGHSLGMRVVAEGVEQELQRRWLEEAGCDYLQGYLLGRPAAPGGAGS